MKITDEARDVLKGVISENNADGLLVELTRTCCGEAPVFRFAAFDENDKPESINGIDIVVPENIGDALDDLIIDMVNGELVVMSSAAGGCGCGGHEDGGCCGSHEEDGCCGGSHEEESGCCGGGGCCGDH